jgi:hypothetical protein
MNKAVLETAFLHARLKINRANRHIQEAEDWFSEYTKADFCRIVIDHDPETGHQLVKAVAEPIPADLALAIGDAFHCMNASFDYVATGLMNAKTGNAKRVTFPSDETRQNLRKSFMRPKPGKNTPANRRITEAFPFLTLQILTAIQPYKGGAFGVWEIRKADNLDKHNLIIPSVTVTELRHASLVDEVRRNSFKGMTLGVEAGGVLSAISYGGNSQLKVTNKGQPTARIIFPDSAEVFPSEPVFPTLRRCSQFSAKVIDRIEAVSLRYL